VAPDGRALRGPASPCGSPTACTCANAAGRNSANAPAAPFGADGEAMGQRGFAKDVRMRTEGRAQTPRHRAQGPTAPECIRPADTEGRRKELGMRSASTARPRETSKGGSTSRVHAMSPGRFALARAGRAQGRRRLITPNPSPVSAPIKNPSKPATCRHSIKSIKSPPGPSSPLVATTGTHRPRHKAKQSRGAVVSTSAGRTGDRQEGAHIPEEDPEELTAKMGNEGEDRKISDPSSPGSLFCFKILSLVEGPFPDPYFVVKHRLCFIRT